MKAYKAGELREDMLVVPVHILESATPSEDGGEGDDPISLLISAALYDFGGWLATREKRLVASSTDDAGPMADSINEFLQLRNIDTNKDIPILTWQEWSAQHSRIVAAKDAEIARLKEDRDEWRRLAIQQEMLTAEAHRHLNALRAQPARQVGGDGVNWKAVAGEQKDIIEGLQARIAALDPAAVVMPEYERNHVGLVAESALSPWNAALDEVARLNRRAIPEELLRRVCKDYTGRENWDALEPDRLAAAAELRALLGKD